MEFIVVGLGMMVIAVVMMAFVEAKKANLKINELRNKQ